MQHSLDFYNIMNVLHHEIGVLLPSELTILDKPFFVQIKLRDCCLILKVLEDHDKNNIIHVHVSRARSDYEDMNVVFTANMYEYYI